MPSSKSSYSWRAMLAGILSESTHVVSDHSRHFLALTVLFLLPISSFLFALPSLTPLLFHHRHFLPPQSLLRIAPISSAISTFMATLIIPVIACASFFFIASAAVAAFTRSVNHGFYGRPVKIFINLRSLHFPILRFIATLLSGALIFSVIVALIVSFCILLLFILSNLDVQSGYGYATPYNLAIVISAVTIFRLHLEWCLAGVISVVESCWGFAPFKRSGELIDGMRLAAICLWTFFCAGIGFALWEFGLWQITDCRNWYDVMPLIAKTMIGSALISLLLLYLLVTHAALYLYCKAVHGELAGEIMEEFASEYVTLPFDKNRVPHVVSVILR